MARELDERRKANEQRAARVEAEAARIAKAQKAWDDRRKIIVGATVLNAMESDPELAARVVVHLKRAVTRDADKKHVLDLIGGATAAEPEPEKGQAAV